MRVFWKMGFGSNAVQAGSLDVDKSNERKKVEGAGKERKWWFRFSFFGSCIPSGSKVDSTISGTKAHNGNFLFTSKFLSFIKKYVICYICHLTSILGGQKWLFVFTFLVIRSNQASFFFFFLCLRLQICVEKLHEF